MATGTFGAPLRRIAIVGGGISGLVAAWGLHHHPDRFDSRLFEAQDRIGGNAVTAELEVQVPPHLQSPPTPQLTTRPTTHHQTCKPPL